MKPSWKSRNKPPKTHTKNIPFVYSTISNNKICQILYSIVESSEQILFYSDGSAFIADNSANAQICSEEVFSDKIDHIIFNGVENIVGKGIITKILAQVDRPVLMMRYNCTQRNCIIYSTFRTYQSTY